MSERSILIEAEADGTPIRERYVPDGGTTIWTRTWPGPVAVDTGQPAPPVEDFTDPVEVLLAELPAATLEEANDVLAQILDIIGGN